MAKPAGRKSRKKPQPHPSGKNRPAQTKDAKPAPIEVERSQSGTETEKQEAAREQATEELEKRAWPTADEIFSLATTDPEACLFAIQQFFLVHPSGHEGQIMKWLRNGVIETTRRSKPNRAKGRPNAIGRPAWRERVTKVARLCLMEEHELSEIALNMGRRTKRGEEVLRQDIKKLALAVFRVLFQGFGAKSDGSNLDAPDARPDRSGNRVGLLHSPWVQRKLKRFGFQFPQDIGFVKKLFLHADRTAWAGEYWEHACRKALQQK